MQIIFGIVGVVLVIVAVVLAIESEKLKPLLLWIPAVAFICLALAYIYVPTGYVGIRTVHGQIQEKPAHPGGNWKVPFIESIDVVNCKQQELDLGDLQIWGETSERTEIYGQGVAVEYQINSEYATWIWANIDAYDTNLVKKSVVDSGFKAATKMFNDTDVTDRSKIEPAVKEKIQKALNDKYGNQVVDIVGVTIGNMNFKDSYNKMIDEKSEAKVKAETAKATAEAKKAEAEGKAEAAKIEAEGKAQAKIIEAEAEAKANKMISESLTPELVKMKQIEKWDGKLPIVSGDGSTIIDIGDLTGNE